MLNANEGQPNLSSLGIPSGVNKGPSRGSEDLAATLQMEELNRQMEQAKIVARSSAPGMAHPLLNAVLGIVAQAVDPQIAGPAMQAGTQARMAPALAEYKDAVAKANDIIDEGERRQKAFQNILASNPEALVPMVREGNKNDMVQLGLATFGLPVPIDPRLKSQVKLEDLYRKQRIAFHVNAAKMMQQAGNNAGAEEQMNKVSDLLNENGDSGIDAGDLFNPGKALTQDPAKVAANYEESLQALQAYSKFMMDHDTVALATTLSGLHPVPKTKRAQTVLEARSEMTAVLGEHMRSTGEADQAKALKDMPEPFQLKWDAIMPKNVIGKDELTREDYARLEGQAHDDAINQLRAMGIEPTDEDVRGLTVTLLNQRLRDSQKLLERANRSQRNIIGESQKAPENAPKAAPMSVQDFQKKVRDYIAKNQKKGQEDYHAAAMAVAADLGDKTPLQVRKSLGL